MGEQQSKPTNTKMSAEKVMRIMDQYPEYVLRYYKSNEEKIENYIVENFWEEDVERWLTAIRNRSPKDQLEVRKIDFLKKTNCSEHKTSMYEHKELIIRRAAAFTVDVYFGNRSFDAERDDITVMCGVGPEPSPTSGTKFSCLAGSESGPKNEWSCLIESTDEETKKVSLKINVPANAIIGRYSFTIKVTSGTQEGRKTSKHIGGNVIVICNPFSPDDTVYMEDEAGRNEYVLNDSGFICVGSFGKRGEGIGKRPWDFAQFDEGVLDCVLLMLQNDSRMKEKPKKTLKKYNSPVFISRVIAAMVNCCDDCGVLWGKWGGDFSDGKKPNFWSDSEKILKLWRDNDFEPVKYGQCWVFSGIVTTALRALGIPSRSVTNFESAHDTDRNETVDVYVDKETSDIMDDTSDSVWNFHVWNECFFRRPDLPEGYDGWQVVDATPQEASDVADSTVIGKSLMQCGPAPLKAIKEGEINIGFDTPFIFSEVNADKVYWFVDKDDTITSAPRVLKNAVGKFIGTKAIGTNDTENIIGNYKYPEGSAEERKAFNKAFGLGSHDLRFETKQQLVPEAFEITIDGMEDLVVGKDIVAKISVKNISGKSQNGFVNLIANSKRHTGKIHSVLKKSKETFQMEADQGQDFTLEVPFDDYIQNIVDNYAINVVVTVVNNVDGNTSVEERNGTLKTPDCIFVRLPKPAVSYEENRMEVVFTNFLPRKLTGVTMDVSFRGTKGFTAYGTRMEKPILPDETLEIDNVLFQPRFGWKTIYAFVTVQCAELSDIKFKAQIDITA